METLILSADTYHNSGYELLDSGNEEKLERYGNIIMSRPDPQAIWKKSLLEDEWKNADAKYIREGSTGKWELKEGIPETWQIKFADFVFNLKFLPSKHLGLFPEQSAHWKWLEEKIKSSGREISVLNLFAYTGGVTMACAHAGASVVHLDASKFVVDAAHKNLDDSGLGDKPVRFIVDDVRKFVEREIKRGNKYDVILLDPPVYGKGANDEVWKIEEDLLPFLIRLKELWSENPLAMILNGYSSIYSHMTYKQMLGESVDNLGGEIQSGELLIRENSGRLLPSGIFARWSK